MIGTPEKLKGVSNMNKVYLGFIAVLLCATVCAAQARKEQPNTLPNEKPQQSTPRDEKQGVLMSGTNINAELQKTLDVNKTQVGDEIIFKTSQSIKQNGQVAVPRGSTLIGRVTEIQRRTKENGMSRISMVFERIQGKQLSMPLNATIVSITNAAAQASLGDSLASDVTGSSQTTTTTSGGGSGGGLLGGVGGTVGSVVNTATSTVGTVTNTAAQTVGTTGQTLGRTVNGLQISAVASGSANSSSTLSTPNKNLRVDKGASFLLRVAN
jgi:hypothetical protein